MSRLYWLLNFVLIGFAVAASMTLMEHRPETRYEMPEAADLSEAGRVTVRKARSSVKKEKNSSPILPYMDELWQRSLFRPDRTEDIGAGIVDTTTDTPAGSADMELIGVGVIGEEAAAIILVKDKTPRRGRRSAEKTEKNTRHVYRKGADVADTGYVIKDISLNQVVLQRGAEERVLQLESGDAASASRAAEAAKIAEQRSKQLAAAAAARAQDEDEGADENKPPAPPPPPPVPVAAGGARTEPARNGNGNSSAESPESMSKDERIRRALEARRRILERRKKAREENENGQ